jgi:hypothetical protein
LQLSKGQFDLKPLLDALRSQCGDAEFGYRMQGFFAHVLARLGAVILEVNSKGHPDIKARMADHLFIVQVKSALHAGPWSSFQLTSGDLAGIAPSDGTKGFLAFLDCADPVSWLLVDFYAAQQFLNRAMPIAAIQAAQELQMSENCSAEFVDIILSVRDRLNLLTFSLLVRRALAGEIL